jgi:hypothetical protein
LAKHATRTEDRDRYRHEEELWLQIAEDVEARDSDATVVSPRAIVRDETRT